MYTELVKELRESPANKRLMVYAADAIEELARQRNAAEENREHWEKRAGEMEVNWHVAEGKAPRWVSVKERLPEKELAFYLCFTDCGIVIECLWTNNKYGLGPFGEWGWRLMDVPQYQKVTHWMPLPQPPKEEHNPVYESIKRGLEQAINGEPREEDEA